MLKLITRWGACLFLFTCFCLWSLPVYGGDASENNSSESSLNESVTGEEFDEFEGFDEFDEDVSPEVFDPLSGYNRVVTTVNDKIFHWFLKPVSIGYNFIVPTLGRIAIGRFFKNLFFPVSFVNNVLQLKFKNAGIECSRFVVNSTLGVLGFGDPAQTWLGLEPHEEDFGQTLGHYGVGSGFHIVLPGLGPSNLRDLIGKFPDSYLTPYSNFEGFGIDVVKGFTGESSRYDKVFEYQISLGVDAYRRLNANSFRLDVYESLQKDSVDFYILMRDAYEQSRDKQIKE